jgi:hypothetical protein
MYFFAETSKTITQSTPVGTWNVAGYQQINVHAWVKGGSGTVYMETYFNNLSAVQEKLTIGPVGAGGWNIAILTRTYPVYAPTLSVVLYNPSTQMDFTLRLYAGCCEPPMGFFSRLFRIKPAEDGEPHRRLSKDVDMNALLRSPDQPEARI